MKELWLKYTDERGETRRVAVSDELFIIGRHPENDLCIPDSRLSREHVRIENYADNFYVSDSGSSNGTTLNGAPLRSSTALKNGDRLNLGGGVEIKVETGAENYDSFQPTENPYPPKVENAPAPNVETTNQVSSPSAASSGSGGIPTAFFWLAPIFGLIILVFVGGLFFAFSGSREAEIVEKDDIPVYTPRPKKTDDDADEKPTPKPTATASGSSNNATSPTPDVPVSLPKTSGDIEKVEQNGGLFLRRIAQSDPRAFLTGKQAETVNSKISQFKGSSALAENLKAVKKNAAQFQSLAESKNLKPQFLAVAALAKIGNVRGDPLAVAQTMLPFLNDLKITLDNKLADDNLLIIAAYERGAAGKPRSLQSTLEAISKTTQTVSPREIRTIWFLKDKGKITDAEYNFALQFLAIGAITQNPKDFNVNTDAVTFD
jgi:FHA domain